MMAAGGDARGPFPGPAPKLISGPISELVPGRAWGLAFALALASLLGAPLVVPTGATAAGQARAADLAVDAMHALVVHAPSASDPRYARMRMEYAAIEMVWRDAKVTFVGLVPGGEPEVMGLVPDGLSIASLRRTAPAAGGFGVRLVRADGRVVHSSGGEVHRAVLLGLAMSGTGTSGTGASKGRTKAPPALSLPPARATADAATTDAPPSPPRAAPVGTASLDPVPVPTMRPRVVAAAPVPIAPPASVPGGTAAAGIVAPATVPGTVPGTVPATVPAPAPVAALPLPALPAPAPPAPALPVPRDPVDAATTLDWGTDVPPGPRAVADGGEAERAAPAMQTLDPALDDRPVAALPAPLPSAPRAAGAPLAGAMAPPVDPVPASSMTPAAPSRAADPWSLWSGTPVPRSARAVVVPRSDARAQGTAEGRAPSSLPVVVASLDPLPAALPSATLGRVREALVAERLEAAKQNGFAEVVLGAELPLRVQAGMALSDGASLAGPDLGLALLVTGSCGAAHPPRPERRWWFGG